MKNALILAVLLIGVVDDNLVFGQSAKYNPYAKDEEYIPAVAPDGKIHWPPFFKSAGLEARFQSYFEIGACTGTNLVIVDRLKANKVDVNTLPEITVTGTVVSTQSGTVRVVDATGNPIQVMLHPKGVSKVTVEGTMPVTGLQVGMMLRIQASVDEHGIGLAPLTGIEVVTPSDDIEALPVQPNRLQSVVGTIDRLYGSDRLRMHVDAGKLHRLMLVVDKDAKVVVNGHRIELTSPGDEIVLKGHRYAGEGTSGVPLLFASKVNVTKSNRLTTTIKLSKDETASSLGLSSE